MSRPRAQIVTLRPSDLELIARTKQIHLDRVEAYTNTRKGTSWKERMGFLERVVYGVSTTLVGLAFRLEDTPGHMKKAFVVEEIDDLLNTIEDKYKHLFPPVVRNIVFWFARQTVDKLVEEAYVYMKSKGFTPLSF